VKNYRKNEIYARALSEIIFSYPAPLDPEVIMNAKLSYIRASSNKNMFFTNYEPAIDCWKIPQKCVGIAGNILSHLQVVDFDPSTLNPFCAYPYGIIEDCDLYYPDPWRRVGVEGNFLDSPFSPNGDGMCYVKVHYEETGGKGVCESGYVPENWREW